jgi:hypothetical protein
MRGKIMTSNQKYELELESWEQALILENIQARGDLLNKVRLCIVRDNTMYARLTGEELLELSGIIAVTCNQIDDAEICETLDNILAKISNLLDGNILENFLDMVSSGELPNIPPEVKELIDSEIKKGGEPDLEMLREKIDELMDQTKNKPYLELNGLTLNQVDSLIFSDWEDPNSTMYIEEEIPFEDLKDSHLLHNARLFLNKIINGEHVETTKSGKLSRKFVMDMFNQMKMDAEERDTTLLVNKVLNEEDVESLHILKVILQLSGLLKKRKGSFYVPKKNQDLQEINNAGMLYTLLFSTYFREFNLSYLDGAPENDFLQDTVPYSLYMLSKHADKWIESEELLDMILLPMVMKQVESDKVESWMPMKRIITPLVEFGLLGKCNLTEEKQTTASCRICKTALFDKFLKFNNDAINNFSSPFM